MNKTTILLADDHAMIRMGLAALIGMYDDLEVVGQTADGTTAVSETLRLKPDVVIMDLMMPGQTGIEATRNIKEALPDTHVLILTTYTSTDGIANALDAGAEGAVFKSDANQDLIDAVRAVADGKPFLSLAIKRLFENDPPLAKLSLRQNEILNGLVRGLTNDQLASELGISLAMVKEHMSSLMAKIGASNRAEAVSIALRKQLLSFAPAPAKP